MRTNELPRKLDNCKRCAKLEDRLKMVIIREMRLRAELVEIRRSAFVKRQFVSEGRSRW